VDTQIPTEVELAFELMPCQAERVAQNPGATAHPCSYFRKWGTYHSFDYESAGPPKPGISAEVEYVGRGALVPEMLSGCRKAPILAVGINPNLPGWWPNLRGSLNPLFDDYRQYAHYFRYRRMAKPELTPQDYASFGGTPADAPPGSSFALNVPTDAAGHKTLTLHWRDQQMYRQYQGLLDGLAGAMSWPPDRLAVGEDLSYGNMVACPSAKWTTQPDHEQPTLPPMSEAQRRGIVGECFSGRRYFLRQLFQSLPSVILVFSQNTASTFIGALQGRFSQGDPKPTDSIAALMEREIVLHFGDLPDGTTLDARVLFGPHPTGNPAAWEQAKSTVVGQLVQCAHNGRLRLNSATGRLGRPPGSCVFCPMLGIGPCDYLAELKPLAKPPVLTADRIPGLGVDKAAQAELLKHFLDHLNPAADAWAASDDTESGPPADA
jgi:hypothetical protein